MSRERALDESKRKEIIALVTAGMWLHEVARLVARCVKGVELRAAGGDKGSSIDDNGSFINVNSATFARRPVRIRYQNRGFLTRLRAKVADFCAKVWDPYVLAQYSLAFLPGWRRIQ